MASLKQAIEELRSLEGLICHGLVNYQKGFSAINEDSAPH